MPHTRNTALFAVIGLLICNTMASHAAQQYDSLARHWSKLAEAIVIGEVVDIQYKSSEPTVDRATRVPHTFVTIKVEETIKGKIASDPATNEQQVTLRFFGGLSDDGEDIVLLSTSVLFDGPDGTAPGDRGMFFIFGNGKQWVPLVSSGQGFTRFMGDRPINSKLYQYAVTNHPFYAARIHPRDILDYEGLAQAIMSGQRAADKAVQEALSPETRSLIENPSSIDALDPKTFRYYIPEDMHDTLRDDAPAVRVPGETTADNVPIGVNVWLKRLFPLSHRVMQHGLVESMLYRDLNFMLLRRNLFTPNNLADVELPPLVSQKLAELSDQTPIQDLMLLQRRILEALYPSLVLKTLDQTMVRGRYTELEPMIEHHIGPHVISHGEVQEDEEPENPLPTPSQNAPGRDATTAEFIAHVRALVELNHSAEELEAQQPVESVDINEPFELFTPEAVPVPDAGFDIPAPDSETDEDAAELKALEASDGNPVIGSDDLE